MLAMTLRGCGLLAAVSGVLLLFRLWEGSMGNPRGEAPSDSFRRTAAGAHPMRVWLIILAILVGLFARPHASAQQNAKNVIVLSGGRGRDSLNRMESSLRAHVTFPVNFSIVDLDNPRFDEKSYRDSLAEALQAAYGKKPDLLFACMDPPLRFAVEYRDKMFPGVPIVFMSVSTLLADKQLWPGVTGVAVPSGAKQTVDLALRSSPGYDSCCRHHRRLGERGRLSGGCTLRTSSSSG